MRIVHIEDFFHPDAGYQVNILSKYMSQLGHEVYVVTSEMMKMPQRLTSFFGTNDIESKDMDFFNTTGVKIIRVPLRGHLSGRSVYSRSIFKIIDNLNPDILYVHGNDTLIGIQYIIRSNKLKYPLITDSHMLEMASENRFNKVFRWAYRNFITPLIVKNNLIVIRTQNDDYVSKCLGIPMGQAPWISVGSDLILFHDDENVKQHFKEQYNIDPNDMIIVYIGKIDEAKGGKILAQAFEKKLTNSKGKDIVLVIVGNTSGDYGREVEGILAASENRIIRFPTQKYIDLPKFYQVGDFAVFPRQCSLSFYDAQACKLPVIAEDNNINLDRLSNYNGLTFEEGNIESFRKQLINMIELDDHEFQLMRQNAYDFVKNNYNYGDIAVKYLNLINTKVKQ